MANLLPYLVHLKILPFEGELDPGDPPGEGGGQPQIVSVNPISATEVEVTVSCPEVPGADRIEYWAGSNNDHWISGSQDNPNVSFTPNEVVFTAPRQPSVNDNSFFCYQGANDFGSAPNYNCNGFVVPAQSGGSDELGAPTIESATAVPGPAVNLSIAPGMNAEDHDVHRVNGDVEFTAGAGNLIAEGIGQAPSSYPDTSVEPTTVYSYRVRSRAAGQTPVQSNRLAVQMLGTPQPSDRPNDPGYPEVLAAHDFSYVPDDLQQMPASGGGYVRTVTFSGHHDNTRRNYLGQLGFEGITGAIPVGAFTSGGIGGDLEVPHVQNGPVAPHGMPFVGRHRLPAGMGFEKPGGGGGTAGGNGGSWWFRRTESGEFPFREIYTHMWLLYEGHKFEGQRVLSKAGYRFTQEIGGGRRHNHYWWVGRFARHRSAITGQCVFANQPEASPGYAPITASSLMLAALPGPVGSQFRCGNGEADYGNWFTGSGMVDWHVGNNTAQTMCINGSSAQVSGCGFIVGRWHRVETILRLGTPDTPNGSFHFYLDGNLVAFVENKRFLSSIHAGEDGVPPDQGYTQKAIRDMYHPLGGIRKPFTDYACIADLYITGVPF